MFSWEDGKALEMDGGDGGSNVKRLHAAEPYT